MKPERDWIDYANLASNLARNSQLAGIDTNLEELKRLQGQASVSLSDLAQTQRRQAGVRRTGAGADKERYLAGDAVIGTR
jgi:hypothetical protein